MKIPLCHTGNVINPPTCRRFEIGGPVWCLFRTILLAVAGEEGVSPPG
jgi:hypothetical protein